VRCRERNANTGSTLGLTFSCSSKLFHADRLRVRSKPGESEDLGKKDSYVSRIWGTKALMVDGVLFSDATRDLDSLTMANSDIETSKGDLLEASLWGSTLFSRVSIDEEYHLARSRKETIFGVLRK
jgi:hypothetical protein